MTLKCEWCGKKSEVELYEPYCMDCHAAIEEGRRQELRELVESFMENELNENRNSFGAYDIIHHYGLSKQKFEVLNNIITEMSKGQSFAPKECKQKTGNSELEQLQGILRRNFSSTPIASAFDWETPLSFFSKALTEARQQAFSAGFAEGEAKGKSAERERCVATLEKKLEDERYRITPNWDYCLRVAIDVIKNLK